MLFFVSKVCRFFPDRAAALHEMRRVLKPNGRVGIAVWTEIEDNEIFAAFTQPCVHGTGRARRPN